jgi:hypothetical protein
MIEIAAAINGFAPGGQVQPPENAVVLVPLQVLQELLAEVRALRSEIFEMRSRQEALEARISGREVQQDAQKEMLALKTTIEARDEELRALKAEMAALEENTARERAYDRQRLAALEHREPEATTKTLAHIDDLYTLMKKEGHPPLSMARAARLLGMSKSGVKHLMSLVRQDSRFEVVRDPHHRQRLLIKLRRFPAKTGP